MINNVLFDVIESENFPQRFRKRHITDLRIIFQLMPPDNVQAVIT